MSHEIISAFDTLDIQIDDKTNKKLERLRIQFETRGTHPLALNSQVLAVHKIIFTPSDENEFYRCLGVTEKQLKTVVKSIPKSVVNPSFHVTSHPFNLLSMYCLHLAHKQISNNKHRHEFMFNIACILHYRFFTSIVNNSFRHGATEKIMMAVINDLSQKFDIIYYKTWKNAIYARCEDLISEKSGHYNSITTGDDAGLLYALTDAQTRIRTKIVRIAVVYYDYKEKGVPGIASRSSVINTDDGEKELIQTTDTLNKMISSVVIASMNMNSFINRSDIDLVANTFSNISSNTLESTLITFSEIATIQAKSNDLDKIVMVNKEPVYVGARILITNIIQQSFRYCRENRINMKDNAAILVKTKNVFSASRIADPEIVKVKNSVIKLIDEFGKPKRETTKSSLRLAFITYILTRALRNR